MVYVILYSGDDLIHDYLFVTFLVNNYTCMQMQTVEPLCPVYFSVKANYHYTDGVTLQYVYNPYIGAFTVLSVWASPEMELLSAKRVYYSQVLLLLGFPVYGLNTWCRSNNFPPAC